MAIDPPNSVKLATGAVYVVAAIHVLALVLVLTHRDVFTDAVVSSHPDWSQARIDDEARSRYLQTLIPHVILPVVFVLRGRRLLEGKGRTRVVITALLGLQLVAHATLPIQLHYVPGYGAWLVAVQAFSLVFELAALWLLWAQADTRRFFAQPRPLVTRPTGTASTGR
jgi:hypothetical protein